MTDFEHRRAGEEDGREHHRRNDGNRIGFKKVGRHACAVADIVADIVGNRCRIARVVLGNASLDLADEIAADIRALGEDTAAEAGEDGNQRSAEAERDKRVDDDAVAWRIAQDVGEDEVVDRDTQ